jgi:cobalamin-dependent methionine synthase I
MSEKKSNYSHAKADARQNKNKKRQEAEVRQAAYDKLNLEQKLANAFGKKEKAKLEKKIAKRDEKKPATPPKEKMG